MEYLEAEYDHFHVVSICVECADIQIVGMAADRKALIQFFDGLQNGLTAASKGPFVEKEVDFTIKVIEPYQVVKITPVDGHATGHVCVAVAHKCADPWMECMETQQKQTLKKMANAMAAKLLGDLVKDKNKENKEEQRAQKILESLDLPDDIFKGLN